MEDLMRDPTAYGVPTLQEFSRNRAKFFGHEDDDLISLFEGPVQYRKDLNKIKYQVYGCDIPSLEKVEAMMHDHGYTKADLDLKSRNPKLKRTMNMVPQGGGKYDVVVNFLP